VVSPIVRIVAASTALVLAACSAGDSSAKGTSSSAASVPDTSVPDTSVPPAAQGQVELYSAAELDRIVRGLAPRTTSGFGRSHENFHYVEGRRTSDGTPEVHDEWTDVAIAQAGRSTVLTGGSLSGSRLQSAGEHRGGTISGGVSRPFAAGDLMIIPPGVPHQYRIAAGDSLRYLTIKVHR
jgi:hypothetical protein